MKQFISTFSIFLIMYQCKLNLYVKAFIVKYSVCVEEEEEEKGEKSSSAPMIIHSFQTPVKGNQVVVLETSKQTDALC